MFMVRATVGTCGDVVAAGEGEVPGGKAEPDRGGDGAGDGVGHVGQQVAILVIDGDAVPAGGVQPVRSTGQVPSLASNAS